jgi:NAD-specific glutamate dehydrogenase
MLQSRKIRLLGAFNHVHIFCDPDPDIAATSFKERLRLFQRRQRLGFLRRQKTFKRRADL